MTDPTDLKKDKGKMMGPGESSTDLTQKKMDEVCFKINMVLDKKKKEILWVEVTNELVDVLFSFLALPVGSIIALLEKYVENPTPIGGFTGLYKSVSEMESSRFTMGEAGKRIFVNPRHIHEEELRNLKVVLDEQMKTEASVFFCPKFQNDAGCETEYAFFPNTSDCIKCKKRMDHPVVLPPRKRVGGPKEIFKEDIPNFREHGDSISTRDESCGLLHSLIATPINA